MGAKKVVNALELTNFRSSGTTTSLGAACGIEDSSLRLGSDSPAALSLFSTRTANLKQPNRIVVCWYTSDSTEDATLPLLSDTHV